MEQHEITFSEDQEWNGDDDDDAPIHCVRGPSACTTTASDETKARTERKATVEMAYMVKQTLRQRVIALIEGGKPSIYTRRKPELHE